MTKFLYKMAAEHDDMHDFHKDLHHSLDDDHPDKSYHKRLAQHHAAMSKMCKAAAAELDLGGASSGDFHQPTGDLHGPSGKAAVPDGVKIGYPVSAPSVHLIPRGSSGLSLDKAEVDSTMEEALRI